MNSLYHLASSCQQEKTSKRIYQAQLCGRRTYLPVHEQDLLLRLSDDRCCFRQCCICDMLVTDSIKGICRILKRYTFSTVPQGDIFFIFGVRSVFDGFSYNQIHQRCADGTAGLGNDNKARILCTDNGCRCTYQSRPHQRQPHMNGCPNNVEKVGTGSVMPLSVPATFEVKPVTK